MKMVVLPPRSRPVLSTIITSLRCNTAFEVGVSSRLPTVFRKQRASLQLLSTIATAQPPRPAAEPRLMHDFRRLAASRKVNRWCSVWSAERNRVRAPALNSETGQKRRFERGPATSAFTPKPDISLRRTK